MNSIIFSRTALLACALGLAGFTVASAQDASTVPSSGTSTTTENPPGEHQHHHRHFSALTQDEWQELKKDREQVLASNPNLVAEGRALHEQMVQHRKNVDSAIEQADPNASALIAKLEAAHRHSSNAGTDSSSGASNP